MVVNVDGDGDVNVVAGPSVDHVAVAVNVHVNDHDRRRTSQILCDEVLDPTRNDLGDERVELSH